MKVLFKYCFVALAGLLGLSLASCSDDDKDNSAKAVLASVSSLSYEAKDAPARSFRVVSDAQWTVDAPEWITVDPATGSGDITVSVAVKDNYEGDVMQLPRRETIVFHGATHASRCEILVIQEGDPFLNSTPISASDFYGVEDNRGVIVSNLTVVDIITGGFMATDGTTNVQVLSTNLPEAGKTITAYGYKLSDGTKMAYLNLERYEEAGTAATLPSAVDITDKLDTYTSNTRSLVTITGVYNTSGAIVVDGQDARANVTNEVAGVGMSELSGHKVTVEAYYAGAVNSGMNIIVRKVEDLGAQIFWSGNDDFEWLDPWAEAAGAGNSVETDDLSANAPALTSLSNDGVTLFDFIESKGYKFIYDKDDPKRIYLQRNCIKFGKTGNHAGITMSPMREVPEGHLYFVFDWCPMRQGSGKIDPVNLIVDFTTNGKVTSVEIPTHGWENGHKLEWIHTEVDLADIEYTNSTTITIRQLEWEVSTANRWFLDNVKIEAK